MTYAKLPKLKVKIFTLFPEFFPGMLASSIVGDALQKGIWQLEIIDIRNFGIGKRKTVDDTVCGGGSGMLIRADVISDALIANINDFAKTKLLYPSPRGELLKQRKAVELSKVNELAIVCGRYEGIDERVIEEYQMEEISIGDYVLSGGELPTMVILDAVIRNLDGVLGGDDSLKEESFGDGMGSEFDNLLEYPQYTKPQNWKGRTVPEVLLSGNHKKIREWRLQKSLEITQQKRRDLRN